MSEGATPESGGERAQFYTFLIGITLVLTLAFIALAFTTKDPIAIASALIALVPTMIAIKIYKDIQYLLVQNDRQNERLKNVSGVVSKVVKVLKEQPPPPFTQ